MIPDLDRVTSPAYLANLLTRRSATSAPCAPRGQSIENGMSYVRRVAQGRIDIVAAELQRRRDGGDPADLTELVARLPDILADHRGSGSTSGLRTRSPSIEWPTSCSTISTPSSGPAAISDLTHQDETELEATRDALTDFERSLSSTRRALHDTLDTLQAELTRRYRTGEATVDSLLQ
jgi:hypothetical protein